MLKQKWKGIQVRADIPGSCWSLDLGTSGLRAVSLRRSGKLTDVRSVALSRAVPGPVPPEQMQEALSELIGSRPPRGEIMVSSLPLHRVFMRSLELPFTKLSLIEQVISSEAELHIPFPLDQVVIDFWPQEIIEESKTRVMMVAVRKDLLSEHLELLATAGLDPAVVGVDILGLVRAGLSSGQVFKKGVSALLEIGASHASLALFNDARLVTLRGFTWGGDTVTTAIMKALKCSFPEAESLKLSGQPDPGQAPQVSEAISQSLKKLSSELKRTIHSSTAILEGKKIEQVLLVGGGTRLAEVKDIAQEVLGVEPQAALLWEGLKSSAKALPGAEVALGGGLRALTPFQHRVNFRREEFSFSGSWLAVRKRLLVSLGLVVGILVMLTLSLEARIVRRQAQLDDLKHKTRSILAMTFPDKGPKSAPGAEVKDMEKSLKKMQEDYDYYRAFSSISGLDVIRDLSRIIPSGIRVQVVELSINQAKVRFRGRTDTYRSADLIKKAIQDSPYFDGDNIKESPVKTGKVGGKTVTVEFIYTIPLANQE